MERSHAPEVQVTEKIEFISPAKLTTKSGIPFYAMQNPTSEAVRLELLFHAGAIYHNPVIASVTAGLMLAGTSEHTMAEIHDKMDDLGGFFDSNLNAEFSVLNIYGLNESICELVTLIENCLYNASFPASELTHLLKDRKEKLKVRMEKVSVLSQRAFQENLFAGTPYGVISFPEDYDHIERQDIVDFYENHYKIGLRRITFVGNLTDDERSKMVGIFDRWENKVDTNLPSFPDPKSGSIHIEKNGAVQVGLRIGKMLFDRTHPDYHKMMVVNTILGDYFGSRLMSNIREDKGYTYGIGSYVSENLPGVHFVIATEVGKEFMEDTLVQTRLEIEKLQSEPISDAELSLVKNYLLGQILQSADGPFAMMGLFSSVEINDLDYAFLDTSLQTILTISPEEILETAKQHLDWNQMLIVTAG